MIVAVYFEPQTFQSRLKSFSGHIFFVELRKNDAADVQILASENIDES